MKLHSLPSVAVVLFVLHGIALTAQAQRVTRSASDNLPVTEKVTVGAAPYLFENVPLWGELPGRTPLGPMQGGIAVDKSGNVYVSTNSPRGIYVFRSDGRFFRTIAPEFAGTTSILIREENGIEFLYGVHLRRARAFKMTLGGVSVLTLPFPKQAGVYGPSGEGYKPTGIAVAPDGAIFVADGYGTSLIHKYDSVGRYLSSFGGRGAEEGKFKDCHGIALDSRSGNPLLLVCDRENRRLQHFDLEGNFIAVIARDLRRPCSASVLGEFVAIAELEGRVTLLDGTNKEVAHLGENPEQTELANVSVPREAWRAGIFTAPHGISWDKLGNLYIQDWSTAGRVTKLALVR